MMGRRNHIRPDQCAVVADGERCDACDAKLLSVRCPDGGACHHGCGATGCRRVRTCGPLSGVYDGDDWPDEVLAKHAPQALQRRRLCRQVRDQLVAALGPGAVEAVTTEWGSDGELHVRACLRATEIRIEATVEQTAGG